VVIQCDSMNGCESHYILNSESTTVVTYKENKEADRTLSLWPFHIYIYHLYLHLHCNYKQEYTAKYFLINVILISILDICGRKLIFQSAEKV